MTEIAAKPELLTPRNERGDIYVYRKSTERQSPEDALLARRVHAESYLGEGFIHSDAIDASGEVASDIDKARGNTVEYYLGFSKEGKPVSTLRKVGISEGLTYETLPGYQLCGDSLTDAGREALFQAQIQGRPIKEISSFGHIPKESAISGLELLRHVLQESHGTGEVWFFTMVTKKYKTLVNLFGPRVVQKIGEEVQLNDDRVGDVSLTPALVDTASFFDDIKEGVLAETNIRKRQRLIGSLRNFTQGLDVSTLSDEVRLLLEGEPALSPSTYALLRGTQGPTIQWTQPLPLDLNNQVDALYAKRLIDEGKVRRVVNPVWDENRGDAATDTEGTWFYYPWLESLTHFPPQQEYRALRHTRDRHLVTEEEQAELYEKSILFAGLSVGSHVLQHMVYAGVGGSHVLADFDTVSVSNLNRLRAGMAQVGESKVDVFAKKVSELDPYMQLELLREGVSEEALSGMETKPDILFDEVDDFAAKVLLRMYAKKHKLPLVMATDVGFKSVIDVERHDIEDVQPFNGRIDKKTVEAMAGGALTPEERMKVTTRLIGLGNASLRLLKSVSDPELTGFPQLDATASQGGILSTVVARDILLGREVPSGRRVLDVRRSMKLSADTSMSEGIDILKKFIVKR